MLRLQIALWVRLRYVRGSLVKDKRPHGSCAVSLICPLIKKYQHINFTHLDCWLIVHFWIHALNYDIFLSNVRSYFDEEGQSVLFEGEEAEHMVLSAFRKRHQISKAVSKYGFSFQHLCEYQSLVHYQKHQTTVLSDF